MDREVPSLFYFLFALRSNQQQVATSPAPLYDYQSLNSADGDVVSTPPKFGG
jgi:hypothetical protein